METADSRFENAVKLADIVAGFFKADAGIQNSHRQFMITSDYKMIAEYVEETVR